LIPAWQLWEEVPVSINKNLQTPSTNSAAFSKLKPELRSTILEALELGNLSILPPRNDGSKKPFPDVWKPFQVKKASKKQLADWYKHGLTGLALVYLPKLKIYCLKFMVVLHLIKTYKKGDIPLTVTSSTVEGAIKLTRFFAGQALKLALGPSTEGKNDPFSEVFMKAVMDLKDDFKGGKLLLQRVRVRVNELLPSDLALGIKDKKLGTWLRDLGLDVREGNANKTYVHWNDEILGA
jgi:hypothetical protein